MAVRHDPEYVKNSAISVLQTVREYWALTGDELLPETDEPRRAPRSTGEYWAVAMYLMHHHYGLNPIEIAEWFDRKRSTVNINIKRTAKRRKMPAYAMLDKKIQSLELLLEKKDKKSQEEEQSDREVDNHDTEEESA